MEVFDIIGMEFFNSVSFQHLLSRFLLNLLVIYIIVRQIYFRLRQNRDYLFTFFILNIVVFFVSYILSAAKLSMGFAFGIFAVFSILRYRTMTVPIKEMTYMFISLSIAILNALSAENLSFVEMIFTNTTLIGFIFLLEKTWVKNEIKKTVLYEKIELIKPENSQLLLEDLKERTGLEIHRAEVGKIDFLRDVAQIRIFYYDTVSYESDDNDV